MSDVEMNQLTPAPVSKTSWSRIVVALAAAVVASAATAYAVQHKNRSGDSQVLLQRRLGPDLIASPEELGDSIHEDSWTCVPEFDCGLFSRACLRIDEETCAKKYFGEEANAKYGSEDKCLEQNGVNGFITQWCPEKPLLAGCNSANRCTFRKEATGRIISKGKNNDACAAEDAFDCPTYAYLATKVASSPPPSPQLAVQVTVNCSGLCPVGMDGTYLAGDELDELHGTPLFTKNGDPTWRIRNTGCGWKVENYDEFLFSGPDWASRAITYPDYYKEECNACTGSCLTVDALTTDEVYYDDGVTDGNLWPEVSLVLGSFDGETFVAA